MPTPSPPDRLRQARAIIAGLAAGDLHGGPLAMARCLARSLCLRQGFVAQDVLDRYLAWWREEGDDTGPVAASVFDRIEDGESPEEAVRLVDQELGGLTAGVNPAHRAGAVLALASFLPDEELVSIARAEAALTHAHPLAGDVSAAVAVICRQLLRGASWSEALATAATACSPEIATALLAPDAPCSPGGFSLHALTAAVVLVGGTSGPAEALAASLRFAGQANYAPVLGGALAGARWWEEALQAWPPPPLVSEFEALAQGWSPLNSIDAEPHTDRIKASLVRSGGAFASKLIKQAEKYRQALKAKASAPTS